MINRVGSLVKTALSVPFTIVREGRKIVESVLKGNDDHAVARTAEAVADTAEAEKAEIQAAIREQAQASIETVKVAEEIREQNVTADKTPL